MTTYKNETTENLFQMLLQTQTDYYNKEIGAEEKLLAISEELRKRGERPLGLWG